MYYVVDLGQFCRFSQLYQFFDFVRQFYRVRTQNSNTLISNAKFSAAETPELKFGVNFLPYTYKV